MADQLPVHEWWAVFLFASLIAALGVVAFIRSEPATIQGADQIQVRFVGKVQNPGYHFIADGATLGEVLSKISPYPDAEAPGRSLSDILEDGETIRFKSTLVNVRIKGAVEHPVTLKLKKGTYLKDALEFIDLSDNADVSKVQDREIKRQNQTITIPVKKSKKIIGAAIDD